MDNDARGNKLRIELHSSSSDSDREGEEIVVKEKPPLTWSHPITIGNNKRRLLSKQLSMKETTREAKWEKRRRQILHRNCMVIKEECHGNVKENARSLTDEDLDELRGSFELGFRFDEENGGLDLCDTLPALDLYFAINRQVSEPKLRLSTSPMSTLSVASSSSTIFGTPSPRSPQGQSSTTDEWKILSPGDSPQLVKTRLRHWAQVVACSVKHG